MATITKLPSGRWRAQVRRAGRSLSSSHATKKAAKAWATQMEAEIESGRYGQSSSRLFSEALIRYRDEVSVAKKGGRWETTRINALLRHSLAGVPLNRLSASHIADWRDGRIETVSGATVNRELNLISAVLTRARREWGWIAINPVADIKRPCGGRPRDRRVSDSEQAAIVDALGFGGAIVNTKSAELAVAFMLAIETAMRQGEILGLTWDRVEERYVTLVDTKNGDKRQVPLSIRARELLSMLPRDRAQCFSIRSGSASSLFRKARIRAGLDDLHFHDSRHEALTRLAGKLSVLELARMVGHRDPRSLMIYYNATADELADKLG